MGPSAATSNVSVSGRVATAGGQGIANSRVTLTNGTNVTMTFVTGSFGNFNFDNVPTGSYTISVSAKRYSFAPQNVQITNNVSGISFVAPEQ